MSTLAGYSETDRHRVALLAHYAVDQLWSASSDSLPGDPDRQGCCPLHCGPCSVLAELVDEGALDEWLLAGEEPLTGVSWWDDQKNQVDRDWLARAWADAGKNCHPERAYER